MKDLKRNSPADQALLDRIGGELVVGLGRVALHGHKTMTVDTHKRAPPGKGSSAPFSGGKGACTSECPEWRLPGACKNCGKRAMGSGKCVAHSEAPAPSPKPKKRYRSPERTCYGGDGSKECPILLDSPLWVKDHKNMKKLLALWVD